MGREAKDIPFEETNINQSQWTSLTGHDREQRDNNAEARRRKGGGDVAKCTTLSYLIVNLEPEATWNKKPPFEIS